MGTLGCGIFAFPDKAFYREAAKRVAECAGHAIADRGRFITAISGGTDPKPLYQLLASPEWRDRIDWRRMHVFWGDERFVPPDDDASNFRMANEAMLSHVPIPEGNIHRVITESGTPQQAAQAYEETLRRTPGLRENGLPEFDLMLLGVGENGHTASLFPHSPLLDETRRLVAADFVKEVGQWRVTMTLPVINNSREILFLVTGEKKAPIVRDVLAGKFMPHQYPAQMVRPKSGNLTWLLDTAAAGLLQKNAA